MADDIEMNNTRDANRWSSNSDVNVSLDLSSMSENNNYTDYYETDDDDVENDGEDDTENYPESYTEENDTDNDTENDYTDENYVSENGDTENDYSCDDDSENYSNDSDTDSDENGFFSDSEIYTDSSDFDSDDDLEMIDSDDLEMVADSDDEMVTDDDEEISTEQNVSNQQGMFSHNIPESEVRQFLRTWSIAGNVDQHNVNPLLRFLQRVWPKLCADVRTLKKTPKARVVITVPPGTYVHIGTKSSLDLLLSTILLESIPDEVRLTFNIDGVPLSKSSNTGFWLILGRIENILSLRKHIFTVGVYYGNKKPRSFNEFLEPFVNEFIDLQETYLHRDKQISLKIHSFICDAPAKADVKGVKHPTGFYGCDKCEQMGVKINRRMTFIEFDEVLRTNGSFRHRLNPEHHRYDSIFEEIHGLNMVNDFPLDPLHVIYLGVMKRLLRLWLNKDEDFAFNQETINEISQKLASIGQAQPKEFQRKCRELCYVGFYKGHEFRTFLLYSGPVVLKNQLTLEKYNHFLLLHVAITILSNKSMCQKFNSLAEHLLKEFVKGMAEEYSVWNVVLCVHSLLHIPKDVRKYGDLNQYSAFDFESFMYQIKRQIKKHNTQQAELCNRIEERNSAMFVKIPEVLSYPLFKKPKTLVLKKIFREVCLEEFTLNKRDGNNWFMTTKSEIVRFEHAEKIENIWYVYGYERKHKSDFYTVPIASSKLKIYQSFIHEERGKLYRLSDITKKMFRMNFDTNHDVFVPLNHCEK